MAFAVATVMSPLPLVRRVEVLEDRVDLLSQLPERVSAVEGQLIALRGDFVSLRGEVGTLRDEVGTLRDEVGTLRDEVGTLRGEVHEGNEETRRQMRVLHEDVISRIALLQEGASSGKGRRSRRKDRNTSP